MKTICLVSVLAAGLLACTTDPEPALDPSGTPRPTAAGAATSYAPFDLGTLGGSRAYALAINNVGQVVGGSTRADGKTHGFIYTGGVMKDIGTLGGDFSEAYGINDRGHVVGASTKANGATHAFLWKAGKMTDLGTIGGRPSGATDINNNEWIGGSADGIPIIWKRGVKTRLKLPPNATFCAIAELNDDGQAVGQCTVRQTAKAFRWDGDKIAALGTLGGNLASPSGINGAGAVVGTSWVTFGNGIHPFLWEKGKMTDLATQGAPQGFSPVAINDQYDIVGVWGNGTQIVTGVWQSGGIAEIGGQPGVDTYASDINSSGKVAGYTVAGNFYRAIVWSPQ
jgi:probable HAF family extracellular repeat protein